MKKRFVIKFEVKKRAESYVAKQMQKTDQVDDRTRVQSSSNVVGTVISNYDGANVNEEGEGEGYNVAQNEPGLMATNAVNMDIVNGIVNTLEHPSEKANGNIDQLENENDHNNLSQDEEINQQNQNKNADDFNKHLSEQIFIEKDVVMNDIIEDMETIR